MFLPSLYRKAKAKDVSKRHGFAQDSRGPEREATANRRIRGGSAIARAP